MNRGMLVYKIFRASEYQAFLRDGHSHGAPIDLVDGYIHMSTAQQVAETLSKHFSREQALHLLAIDSEALDALHWEPSRGGALFPHLYRSLRVQDVIWAREISLGADGHDIGEIV